MSMSRTAKRRRDRKRTPLFAEIDPGVVARVNAEAATRGLNKWEIVEEALIRGLDLLGHVEEPYSLDLHDLTKSA